MLYTLFFFYNFCKNHGAQILENNNNNLRIILRLISCHATLKSCYCHNPNYNVNSTQFNLNWSWFWHEYDFTHHPAWNSNLSERNIAEVFCLRPYLTILTTTKYNLTQLCSGGGASIFPLGLTLSQLQEQLKGQHQGWHQRQHYEQLNTTSRTN